MFNFGVPELVVVLVIVLVLFGGKKIPELTRSIGESIRELKLGLDGGNKDKKEAKTSVEKGKSKKT